MQHACFGLKIAFYVYRSTQNASRESTEACNAAAVADLPDCAWATKWYQG